MAEINMGSLYTNTNGSMPRYDCVLSYNSVTRDGTSVQINNLKVTMTRATDKYTRNRVAGRAGLGGSKTSLFENETLHKSATNSPKTITFDLGSPTYVTTESSLKIYVALASTGGSSTWDNFHGNSPLELDTSISVPPAYPLVTINSLSRTLNTITLNIGSTQATPTNIQVYNGNTKLYEGNSLKPTVTGLIPNTTYNLKVRGYANGGWGEYSSVSSISTYDYARITGANDFNDTQNPYLTYYNAGGNNNPQLQACLSWTGEADISYRDVSKTGSNYTFPLTDSERNVIRNAMKNVSEMTITYYLRTTVDGKNYYSRLAKKVTIVNAKPVFSDFTYEDTNATSIDITGNNQILIKGISNIKFTVPPMVAQKSAIGKAYNCFSGNDYVVLNYSTATQNITLNNAKSGNLSVQALDSRGLSTIVKKTAPLIEYSKPSFEAGKANRKNNIEEEVSLTASGKYTNWTGLNKSNDITSVRYRYRKLENNTWGSWSAYVVIDLSNVSRSNGAWSMSNITIDGDLGSTGFDIKNTYQIEIEVKDKISTSYLYPTLNGAMPLLWKDRENKRLGIGKKPTKSLDVAGDILAEGNIITQGKIILSSGNEVLDWEVVDEW